MIDYDSVRILRNHYLQSEQGYQSRPNAATLRYYLRDRDAFVKAAVDYFEPEEPEERVRIRV